MRSNRSRLLATATLRTRRGERPENDLKCAANRQSPLLRIVGDAVSVVCKDQQAPAPCHDRARVGNATCLSWSKLISDIDTSRTLHGISPRQYYRCLHMADYRASAQKQPESPTVARFRVLPKRTRVAGIMRAVLFPMLRL